MRPSKTSNTQISKNQQKKNQIGLSTWIVFALLICLGLGVFFYPQISDTYVAYRMRQEQMRFEASKQKLEALRNKIEQDPSIDEQKKIHALQEAWQALINQNADQRSGTVYENGKPILSLGNVIIPDIHVNLSIHYGSSDQVLYNGAGLFEHSDPLDGGMGKRIILTAHSGLPRARFFTDLNALKKGSLIFIENFKETLAYKVESFSTVLPKDVEALQPDAQSDLLTLMTCTPIGINTHRLLVHARRVQFEPQVEQAYHQIKEQYEAQAKANRIVGWIIDHWIYFVISLVVLLILLIGLILRRRQRNRQS